MASSPSDTQKWRKWMLMESIGLTPVGFRETEVKRYLPTEIDNVVSYLSQELSAHRRGLDDGDLLILVKPVDATAFGQFPNIRFRNLDEMPLAAEQIRSNITSATRELWICKTCLDYSPETFAGRYLVHLQPLRQEVIEIVWWESPRLLNSIAINTSPNPYLMVQRESGQKVFRIRHSHLGSQRSLSISESVHCVQLVYEHLHRHAAALADFEQLVEHCDMSLYDIEFKFTKGVGVNIDWDTAYDGRLLQAWRAG